MESLLGYYPCVTGVLTRGPYRVREQCQVGSLTGAVASQRVTEAPKGSLRMVGNHSKSVKAEGSLLRDLQVEQAGNWGIVIRRMCMETPSLKG